MNALQEPIKIKPKYEQMTYFNNPRKFVKQQQYDLYFAFSRPYPIFDQRKLAENRKFPQDIRNNIFEQVLLFKSRLIRPKLFNACLNQGYF